MLRLPIKGTSVYQQALPRVSAVLLAVLSASIGVLAWVRADPQYVPGAVIFAAIDVWLWTKILWNRRGWLLVDNDTISIQRPSQPIQVLLSLEKEFGVSILASASRSHVVVAVTSPTRVWCVGADLSASNKRSFDRYRSEIVTVAGDELAMADVLPDGDPIRLGGDDLLCLIDVMLRRKPAATQCCYLSDADGKEVVLARDVFRAAHHTFRLDEPFEWMPTEFEEDIGATHATFQATWLRQEQCEVVLISLQGTDVRRSIYDVTRATDHGDPYLLRDAQLAFGSSGPPPTSGTRIAVDRLFMLPLRRAFDRASKACDAGQPRRLD